MRSIKEMNKRLDEYENEILKRDEIIKELQRRIDKTYQAIDELLYYDDFKDITNASFGNVKEELKFYLSGYKHIEDFRKNELKKRV